MGGNVIDLTLPLGPETEIHAEPGYRDPPFLCSDWCAVAERGYRVSELRLGTQTGTHIDAPAHFVADGATLESLPVAALVGPFLLIDLPPESDASTIARVVGDHAGQEILFVRTPDQGSRLTAAMLESLLALPIPVWVVAGAVTLTDDQPLGFHRRLGEAGRFLVENLDLAAARLIGPGGDIIALPLRLTGTSGSPCRVIYRET